MDNIEENFYKTFGIEPQKSYKLKILCDDAKCTMTVNKSGLQPILDNYGNKCKIIEEFDSTISDRILLELICILNDFEGINVKGTTIKELKEELLKQCIEPFEYPIAFEEHHEIDKLYHKVQSLFKGGE